MQLANSLQLLRPSDSGYLKKRFDLISLRGIDQVQSDRIHGSLTQIEKETLNILKEKRKRFNP